jgi:hypothetical protein
MEERENGGKGGWRKLFLPPFLPFPPFPPLPPKSNPNRSLLTGEGEDWQAICYPKQKQRLEHKRKWNYSDILEKQY